jgi:hypothetical protein
MLEVLDDPNLKGWAVMNRHLTAASMALAFFSAPALADSENLEAVLGGAVGGGLGALIGNELGGRSGAIVGGALGAATGTAATTAGPRHDHLGHGYREPRPVGYYEPYRRGSYSSYCPPGQAKKGRC